MYTTFNVAYLGFTSNEVEVGYYTTATKLYTILLALFTAFTSVMIPRMSSLVAENKMEEFKKLSQKSSNILFGFSIPLIIYASVYAPYIINLIAGMGYEGAILPMRIILPLVLVIGYEQILICHILMPLKKDKAKIQKGYARLVEKGKMTQEAVDAILAKITPGLKEDLCADCDLIVEAAFEDMGVKKTTFQELDKIAKPECIFASNTSSLSITEIGNGLTRPMVGMHFFNPADRMKLIEVIAGVNTPDETVSAIKKISEEIGKTPVQVNEAAGFVVNRILIPMINEAAFIKMEGVSDITGIDAAMKLGANHPMGPLELGDFIGLDICLAIMDVLYKETGDSKYRACPLIRKMVRGGNLGAKSGKGFYVYNADRTKTPVDAQ